MQFKRPRCIKRIHKAIRGPAIIGIPVSDEWSATNGGRVDGGWMGLRWWWVTLEKERERERVGEGNGRKEGKERAGRKRGKSGSFVGIRSTRHGRLIKGLFQSLTESSREGEMIKTQTILSPRSPPITHLLLLSFPHSRRSLSFSNCLRSAAILHATDRLLCHPLSTDTLSLYRRQY